MKAKLKQTTTVANYRPERPTPHESKLEIGQWANFVTTSEQKAIKAIFTIFSSEFKTSDVLNTWLQKSDVHKHDSVFGHVRHINPRLSGQKWIIFKFLLSLNSQKRLEYKENITKYRSLSWKAQIHVRILIYWTWPISICFAGMVARWHLARATPSIVVYSVSLNFSHIRRWDQCAVYIIYPCDWGKWVWNRYVKGVIKGI